MQDDVPDQKDVFFFIFRIRERIPNLSSLADLEALRWQQRVKAEADL